MHGCGVHEVKQKTGEMLSREQLRGEMQRDQREGMDRVEMRRAENDDC